MSAKSSDGLDTYGKRVKYMRLLRGMNQVELRSKMEEFGVKIGETYISELERSEKMPVLDVAAAMAQALSVTTDYLALIVDEVYPIQRTESEPHYMSPEADEVARLVDAMSADNREIVASLARSLSAPAQTRQERREDFEDVLDLIEIDYGIDARKRYERKLGRGKVTTAQ